SYKDGKPATFAVNQTIPGWQEALLLMQEGAQWKLFLPPNLGYGNRGPLEGQGTIFELELIEVLSEDQEMIDDLMGRGHQLESQRRTT
ncbi:MAG: FKBP-type peptidyl-prolyl cis-trans isomerase, partial [Deltaproteobacteria bacterium]|nr:FKBP-type peptidyl-prolyl cis-trans isomerase [Deltaproteobacteria bacterium]